VQEIHDYEVGYTVEVEKYTVIQATSPEEAEKNLRAMDEFEIRMHQDVEALTDTIQVAAIEQDD
jgi:hypothetical protein